MTRVVQRPRPIKSHSHISLFFVSLCLFLSAFSGPASRPVASLLTRRSAIQTAPSSPSLPSRQEDRIKIADGEYVIVESANSGAVGPFGEEVYDFHEPWAIWRSMDGEYEVTGTRQFESPRGLPHADPFLVRLSRDLTVIDITEFAELIWIPNSSPLTCEFLASELHCSSGQRGPKAALEVHTLMQPPFGLLWPISAFSLSSITQEAERDLRQTTPVELARIEQPSRRNPLEVTVLSGQLRYLGEEHVVLAEQSWNAHKFSLKVALEPPLSLLVSSRGILLSVAVDREKSGGPTEEMKLVRFHQWAAF
jgi:hypothetical protein